MDRCAKYGSIAIFILVCLTLSLPVHAHTGIDSDFPHLVEIDVKDIFLFNLIKCINAHFSDDNLRTVFRRILDRHNMSFAKFNIEYSLTSLESKLRRLWNSWQKNKSGSSHQKLIKKWEKTVYKLKVQHKTGTPNKRKLEEEVKEERSKRRKLETEFEEVNEELTKCKEEKHELERQVDRLSNSKKRKQGQRGKTKRKQTYSASQKRRQKKQKISSMKQSLNDMSGPGMKPRRLDFENEDGDIITIGLTENGTYDVLANKITKDDIDEMIFIMDNHNVTDRAYHEIAQKHIYLPRGYMVKNRRRELNKTCEIFDLEGEYKGVYKSLKSHLIQNLSDPSKAHLIQDKKVKIKFSGDGTRAGVKKHMINVSYTIIGEDTCMSEKGNYLLAIVQCPEKGEIIEVALKNLIDEFNSLTSVEINGETIEIEKYVGGDLKFLNQVTGIAGFGADFSCLWCKCHKLDRADIEKDWSMTDVSKRARTVDEITKFSQLAKTSKARFNVIRSPLFTSIPIHRVIPDTLHLFLRIMDQLVNNLTSYLQKEDNIIRCTAKTNLQNCTNLMRFENFVRDLGIYDWKYIIKDSKIEARSFSGPEHRRILANINLDLLIPNHPKLELVKSLWTSFQELASQLNSDLSNEEIDAFQIAAKKFVEEYHRAFLCKDITPYMHVLAYHVPEVMRMYGNISYFCQQGLEKLNHLVTKWYFRSTNFGSSSLKQIMQKQHRIHLLEEKCKRQPKWQVTCSLCNKQDGHNKRTCPLRLSL